MLFKLLILKNTVEQKVEKKVEQQGYWTLLVFNTLSFY